MIKGSIVAIITPMFEDGSIDWDSYRQLIDWHIESGTDAIVAVGTTGESPTVDHEENCKLIEEAVRHAAGRIPVIAGTGSNATQEALELTQFASKVGAVASLQVVPYYNKPTQEGMYQHFKTIAEKGGLPVILYNVPGRTVADLSNDTVLRLAQVPGVIGLKDATGDIPRVSDLLARLPGDFAVYSGNDDSALALIAMGGHGVISVTANIAPAAMAQLCRAAFEGRWSDALAINRRLLPLHLKLFVEANPSPAKWALQQMGRIKSGIRLPLLPLSEGYHATVRDALKQSGVLS
ncbi:MAG: 4-hydroxy-tetrahydrodipicolinate synthase [Burkholderiaceae bacterium]|jgi:4-hydroxy-tetrahydrodipicolinate synthase|nr:4-hydroxy-tetrahydrodipicolinate synthase [Betaproteobacteria bacterium]